MPLYKDRYRAESARLKNWDYSSAGYYFVTICTWQRMCFLGEIVDGQMRLSTAGLIVAEEWQKTGDIRKNIALDEWVVMPNHIHGIISITDGDVETPRRGVSTNNRGVSTNNRAWKPNSLGSIMNQFKSVCTKRIRSSGHDFGWQARYYDHIIRNEESLLEIREYIVNNPQQWDIDKNNPVNFNES